MLKKMLLIITSVLGCVEAAENWGRGSEDVLKVFAEDGSAVSSTRSEASADKGYPKRTVFITYTQGDRKNYLGISGDATVSQLRRALADALKISYRFRVTDADGNAIDSLSLESGDIKLSILGKLPELVIH